METCAAPSPRSSARPRSASALSKCTKPCATPIAPPETSKTQKCRRAVCSSLPGQDTPETSCRCRERRVNEARTPRSRAARYSRRRRVPICRIGHVPCKVMNSIFTPVRWLDGLWRDRVFVKLWGSLTITHFGGQITFLALPLTAALMLDASPLEMGLLTAMEALPFPLFGLFAGVLIDRVEKLPIIIWADIGRGLALASVPLCAWAGWLSMPVLYSAGFLVGLGTVAGWPAYQVFMTERVGRKNLVEANAKIGISDSAAQLIGPGVAGALIQWLTAPIAILADACAFLASAALLHGIPPAASGAPKHAGRSVRGEIAEGLEVIWRNGTLRTLAWALAVWNIFRHAYIAIVVLFAVRELGLSAGHVGALFMLAGVGSLAAAGVVKPLNASLGFGRTMLRASPARVWP